MLGGVTPRLAGKMLVDPPLVHRFLYFAYHSPTTPSDTRCERFRSRKTPVLRAWSTEHNGFP